MSKNDDSDIMKSLQMMEEEKRIERNKRARERMRKHRANRTAEQLALDNQKSTYNSNKKRRFLSYCDKKELNVEVAKQMVTKGKLIYTDNETWCSEKVITDITTNISESDKKTTVNVNLTPDELNMVMNYRKYKLKMNPREPLQLQSNKEEHCATSKLSVKKIIPHSTIANTNFAFADRNLDTNCSSAPSKGIYFEEESDNISIVDNHEILAFNTKEDDDFSHRNDEYSINEFCDTDIYGADDMAVAMLWEDKDCALGLQKGEPEFVPLKVGEDVSLNAKDRVFFRRYHLVNWLCVKIFW